MTSMTGYGRAEARERSLAITIEIKTVNQRFLEIVVKLPNGWWQLEAGIKTRIARILCRGRVEVYIQAAGDRQFTPVVDADLAKKYLNALQVAERKLGLRAPSANAMLWRLPEVVRLEERAASMARIAPPLWRSLEAALAQVVRMRRVEGRKLAKDIGRRIKNVSALTAELRRLSSQALTSQEKKIRARLSEFLPETAEPSRIRETVLQFIKGDVTEELVRLESHLAQFTKNLQSAAAAGRRLDFLIQEINREVNTIGSKCTDAVMVQRVVSCKEELEKIREQIQNLE